MKPSQCLGTESTCLLPHTLVVVEASAERKSSKLGPQVASEDDTDKHGTVWAGPSLDHSSLCGEWQGQKPAGPPVTRILEPWAKKEISSLT